MAQYGFMEASLNIWLS